MKSKLELIPFVEKELKIDQILNNLVSDQDSDFIKNYYFNCLADAEYSFKIIEPFINKKKKILEIGGGIHLLSFYLDYLGYNITSLEPGGFSNSVDKLRSKILSIKLKKK